MLLSSQLKKSSKRLIDFYKSLPSAQQAALLEYAEFLGSKYATAVIVPLEVYDIPRPDSETLIAALKRLRKTYPGLDNAGLLNQSSALMAQHLIQGREAKQVIDDLQVLFGKHYQQAVDKQQAVDE